MSCNKRLSPTNIPFVFSTFQNWKITARHGIPQCHLSKKFKTPKCARTCHPAIAASDGTQQWHGTCHGTQQRHPDPATAPCHQAPSNGTQQWHSAMAPLLEVGASNTAITIWGKNKISWCHSIWLLLGYLWFQTTSLSSDIKTKKTRNAKKHLYKHHTPVPRALVVKAWRSSSTKQCSTNRSKAKILKRAGPNNQMHPTARVHG